MSPRAENEPETTLSNHAERSFRVLSNVNRTFVIHRGHLVERVNLDRITQKPAPDKPHIPVPFNRTSADAATKEIEGQPWLLDSISEHRKAADGALYLRVHWHGPYDSTCEPRATIPKEAISRYFARRRRKNTTKYPKQGIRIPNNSGSIVHKFSKFSNCGHNYSPSHWPPNDGL